MEKRPEDIAYLGYISIDACSVCRLSCPCCPRSKGLTKKVTGDGFLRAAAYAGLLEKNPGVREVEFSGYGEPLLNPELGEIFRISAEKGVAATLDRGSNLNYLDEKTAEALVRYKVRKLAVSIDGVTEATYRRYRLGGSLAAVLSNIKLINRYKSKYRSKFPKLEWRFVAFGHNQHEIAAARRRAKTLRMDFCVKLNNDDKYSPLRDRRSFKKASGLPVADREEYFRRYGRSYPPGVCSQLWYSPQITWDGWVTGCSTNHWMKFGGNVFKDGLKCLNSPKIRYARRMISGLEPRRGDIPCASCPHYLEMKKAEIWFREPEGVIL